MNVSFSGAWIVSVGQIWAMKQHNKVTILFDGAAFTQIGQHGLDPV